MKSVLTASLRQSAIYIPEALTTVEVHNLRETTAVLVANLAKLGYGVSEPLLKALNQAAPSFQSMILERMKEIAGVNKNWTPLVKGWDNPTGEGLLDHIVTWFVNKYNLPGTTLTCGHKIPANTFPLNRYNGCPFCGTPFTMGEIEHYKQNSSQKILELWREGDARSFLSDLLTSKTALDATQMDSLHILLAEFGFPAGIQVGIKETLMCVIDFYRSVGEAEKAQSLFTSPTDILRYLWYKHTGFLQIVEPKTIIQRATKNKVASNRFFFNKNAFAIVEERAKLKLKYSRRDCLIVANWLNNLELAPEKICEIMHPKRGMWVRFIRALRLVEYSKRPNFEKLATVLDLFYKEEYEVWQGRVEHFRLRYDAANTFRLLQQRPGLFARSLFANMLWFGADEATAAFANIIGKVPARLVFTLDMYAEAYFDASAQRSVKPLGGVSKKVSANHLLSLYEKDQLNEMKAAVGKLCRLSLMERFAAKNVTAKTIYIDPVLYTIPLPLSDRSSAIQDIPAAIAGSRFPVEGNTVRLFMQWGKGLKAQPLDMDLSCTVLYDHKSEFCSFSSLSIAGCKHSGDIRSIPDMVGTAEYIEIDLPALQKNKANLVVFACNAYSSGGITPNLVLGWMNSGFPMKISETTGVAYDPSCVQHQVRVINTLTKGLVFGALDVNSREIIWLEHPFDGQVVQNLGMSAVNAMLQKLRSKMSIGEALGIKAAAQQLAIASDEEADEVYTSKWARNAAAVSNLLFD
ncbi:hypothetical protein LZZ85_01480 [Terrimonas sp. NA20]|uniref:Uncharacterized protein n=1 Tax=Terrimonas ginsenosidimutans TaxID=2908004 RepID=A0ABS9KKS2_9BACT|nr:hypothetical protein [Terrimonas ginsenosidimutans]MCG2612922.1 hypothetical protein [Terrimonas ginsenosidimutans]